MANGEDLSIEELKKLCADLEAIKIEIANFATARNIDFSYNVRGWPNILLRWQNQLELECTLQLYMNDDKKTFTLWIAVYKNIDLERYIFTKFLNQIVAPPFEPQWLICEIQKGVTICDSLRFKDLSPLQKS